MDDAHQGAPDTGRAWRRRPKLNRLVEVRSLRLGSDIVRPRLHDAGQHVTGGEEAERHYLAALERPEASFERARTQLLYGAWLRRARRKTESRAHLIAALDNLERAGAPPWAQKARDELAATGAATQPGQAGPAPLTPQERQVTRLAAQGLPNRDIAAQLFLSPRTVAYHLYKAYPKSGSPPELNSTQTLSFDRAKPASR
jgi:ATP/maltotriose-dependent transcriptional regulator MalT